MDDSQFRLSAVRLNEIIGKVFNIIKRLALPEYRISADNLKLYEHPKIIQDIYERIDKLLSFTDPKYQTKDPTDDKIILVLEERDEESAFANALLNISLLESLERSLFNTLVISPLLVKIELVKSESDLMNLIKGRFNNSNGRAITAFVFNSNEYQFEIHLALLIKDFYDTITKNFDDFRVLLNNIPNRIKRPFAGDVLLAQMNSYRFDDWSVFFLSIQMYLATGKRITQDRMNLHAKQLALGIVPADIKSNDAFLTRYLIYLRKSPRLLTSSLSLWLLNKQQPGDKGVLSLTLERVEDVVIESKDSSVSLAKQSVLLLNTVSSPFVVATSSTSDLVLKVQRLERENSRAVSELQDLKKSVADYVSREDYDKLQEQFRQIQKQLSSAMNLSTTTTSLKSTTLVDNKDNMIDVLNERFKQLQIVSNEQESKIKELNKEILLLQEKLKASTSASTIADSKTLALLGQTRAELKKVTDERDALIFKSNNLSALNEDSKQEIDRLSNEIKGNLKEFSICRSVLQGKTSEVENYKQLKIKSDQQIAQLKDKVSDLDRELVAQQDKFFQQDKYIESLKKTMSSGGGTTTTTTPLVTPMVTPTTTPLVTPTNSPTKNVPTLKKLLQENPASAILIKIPVNIGQVFESLFKNLPASIVDMIRKEDDILKISISNLFVGKDDKVLEYLKLIQKLQNSILTNTADSAVELDLMLKFLNLTLAAATYVYRRIDDSTSTGGGKLYQSDAMEKDHQKIVDLITTYLTNDVAFKNYILTRQKIWKRSENVFTNVTSYFKISALTSVYIRNISKAFNEKEDDTLIKTLKALLVFNESILNTIPTNTDLTNAKKVGGDREKEIKENKEFWTRKIFSGVSKDDPLFKSSKDKQGANNLIDWNEDEDDEDFVLTTQTSPIDSPEWTQIPSNNNNIIIENSLNLRESSLNLREQEEAIVKRPIQKVMSVSTQPPPKELLVVEPKIQPTPPKLQKLYTAIKNQNSDDVIHGLESILNDLNDRSLRAQYDIKELTILSDKISRLGKPSIRLEILLFNLNQAIDPAANVL